MIPQKQQRTLKEIFVSTFHDKISFQEFLNLKIEEEFSVVALRKRKVYAPSARLKKIHRFINGAVLEYATYNKEVVYSYRKGIKVRDAIEKHAGSCFFFQTDISDFYHSIRREDVYRALRNQLCTIPVTDVDQYLDRLLQLMVIQDHIPVGFSTSPLLSNICLYHFDNTLQSYCQSADMIYTRYSDDLIISSQSEISKVEIENKVRELLESHVNKFVRLNVSKTKLHRKGQYFKLLGLTILPNGVVTIPKSDKREIESLLYFFLTDRDKFSGYTQSILKQRAKSNEMKSLYETGVAMLSGKLIALNAMDLKYVSKLRRKYGNTLIDMFLRKSVT